MARRHSYTRDVRERRRRARAARLLRGVAIVAGVVASLVATLAGWRDAEAASSGSYRDDFNTASYSNSDGTIGWTTPWVEIGESDGPTAGFVRFETIRCSGGSCLWFDDNSTSGVIGARRQVDLSGAGAAVLTFSYQREQDTVSSATEFYVEVSATGAAPWTRLQTIVPTTTDTSPRVSALNLSQHISSTTTIRFVSNGANTDNELYLDDLQVEAVPASAVAPDIWFTTRDNTTTGVPSLMSWQDGDLLALTDPGLTYEPGTSGGTVRLLANWDPTFGSIDVSGFHLVTANLTIGGSVSLLNGDLLFHLDNDTTVTGTNGALAVKRNDVVRFRPQTPGDYTTGSFALVLQDPLGAELRGMTLVEQATRVGEVVLNPGSFLFSRAGGSEDEDVWLYVPTSAGPGTTAGSVSKLLEGNDMGFDTQVWGLELLETGKGWPFPKGSIVFSLESNATVAGVAVTKRDLVTVVVGRTSLSATASVTAILAFEGDDLGLDEDKERFDGFTFANLNAGPVFYEDLPDRSDPEGAIISLSAAASDPNGDTLTYGATGLPPGLSIASGNGLISGTIDYTAASNSPYSVEITVTEPSGATAVDTFVWTVVDVNQAPALTTPGDQASSEGDAVSLAIVGSDPDGDDLIWTAVGLPTGLSIDPDTGLIAGTLDHDAAAGSPYSATVRATDDGTPSEFTEVAFDWVVADENRPPTVGNPGDRNNDEGDPVTFAMSGSDPDGNDLTWSAAGLPDGLAIDPDTGIISGTITFFAAAGSPYSSTVRATDDGSPAEFAEVAFTWTVADNNRSPQLTDPGDQTDAEGDAVSLQIVGSDPDGDSLTWTASGLPLGLAIDVDSGLITGTPTYDSAAIYPVAVRATDDGFPSSFSEVSFTWTIDDTNRQPQIAPPSSQSNAEGEAVSLALAGNDPDGDGLTWSATGLPPGLTIGPASGTISGTLGYNAAQDSPYSVTVRASDDGTPALFDETTFTWSVSDVNRAPSISSIPTQTSAEGQAVSLQLSAVDPDGNGVTWTAVGLPPGLSIGSGSGQVSGTLGFGAAGSYSVTVRATDNGSPVLFAERSFSWTITDTNRAAVLQNPGPQAAAEGEVVAVAINGSDPDGDDLTWSATGLPPGLSISPTSGSISGTLGFDLAESYSVTVAATDNGAPALQSQISFVWAIGDVNRPPQIGALADRSTEVGASVTISPTASDPDGDGLTWSASGLPAGTSISASTGSITGTPGTPGTYTITVVVIDDGAPPATDSESFTWMVDSPPGFPVGSAVAGQEARVGVPVELAVEAVHPDGLELSYSATGLPDGLAIDGSTGVITGTPTTPQTRYTLVTVTDERGQAVVIGFVWTVLPVVNEPPVVVDDVVVVASDSVGPGGVVLDAVGNDYDPEASELTLVSAGPAAIGTVTVVDGLVVFVAPSHWLGTVAFPYTVSDGTTAVQGLITITIDEALSTRLGTSVLAWDPAGPPPSFTEVPRLTASNGTEVVLGTLFQSLHVLRVPLALLGGAVFWSLLFGGLFNLGFVVRGGLPRLVRRSSRTLAVVMVPHGGKVDVTRGPGEGDVVTRLLATERGLEATGRRIDAPHEGWIEVRTSSGKGWVRAFFVTEEVDRAGFAEDGEPLAIVRDFVSRLRARADFSDLVSRYGLFIAHHAPIVHFPLHLVPSVMEDSSTHVWKGRNPAYPDFEGTFDLAVATSVLDAYDHPERELRVDAPVVPSTVIPVEFTNFHSVSIGADVHGPERLEQAAWLIMFTYEDGHPKIIGLVREG